MPSADKGATTESFLDSAGWSGAAMTPLAGGASGRTYARLTRASERAVLMTAPEWTHPDGEAARDPFMAVGEWLRSLGLSAPAMLAWDRESGLALMEDLGDAVFDAVLPDRGNGGEEKMARYYRAATEALLRLHAAGAPATLPVPGGGEWRPPSFDGDVFVEDVSLFSQWYAPVDTATAAELDSAWASLRETACAGPQVLVLRDYHSPNLVWREEAQGLDRVGILDYQDALIGSPAYDLVSLLQDARLDVPESLEAHLLDLYVAGARESIAGFDEDLLRTACAVWGAQRNARILGLFVRLARQDGNPSYLRHMPRVRGYLERNLSHPALSGVAAWMRRHLPEEDSHDAPPS